MSPYKEILTKLRAEGKTVTEIMAITKLTRGQIEYYLRLYDLIRTRKGYPYVARNRVIGGTLIIRLPKELHKKLADLCEAKDQSINKFVTTLIEQAVDS